MCYLLSLRQLYYLITWLITCQHLFFKMFFRNHPRCAFAPLRQLYYSTTLRFACQLLLSNLFKNHFQKLLFAYQTTIKIIRASHKKSILFSKKFSNYSSKLTNAVVCRVSSNPCNLFAGTNSN